MSTAERSTANVADRAEFIPSLCMYMYVHVMCLLSALLGTGNATLKETGRASLCFHYGGEVCGLGCLAPELPSGIREICTEPMSHCRHQGPHT
jgi:hypothetical protein